MSVGQRIHSLLYGGRNGIVYAIHGEQHPEGVQSLAHAVMHGGGAEFDIVFDNGTISHRLPECILRGVQWRVHDDIADADEIAAALANAATMQATRAAQAAETRQRADDKRVRLATASEYRHLKQGDDVYSGRLAAANIRIELKRAFPGVKFSVRMTHYGAVSVHWTDGPRQAEVEALCRRYKAGRFNSMEDIYEHAVQPWHHVFGGLEYLSVSREESAALVAQAIDAVYAGHAASLAAIPKPAPEQFRRGELIHVCVPGLARDLHTLICAQLRDVA
ncbi:hypothetical protein CY652_17860 [Burkholderia sp. WAC0059]|nr:hypothetical protein CY652_17860 [Burkholderia sp. WAC0059]